jgi:hypothetical protein
MESKRTNGDGMWPVLFYILLGLAVIGALLFIIAELSFGMWFVHVVVRGIVNFFRAI